MPFFVTNTITVHSHKQYYKQNWKQKKIKKFENKKEIKNI